MQITITMLVQFLMVSYLHSCSLTKPQSVETAKVVSTQRQRSQVTDPVVKGPFDEDPRFAEAWRRFIEDTVQHQYRPVTDEDYGLSDRAKASLGQDLDLPFKFRAGGGEDFNKDGRYRDFIVVVVDEKRLDERAKFSILIFNEPRTADEGYTWHWVYRDRDLSTTVLSWFSGGVGLRTYKDDGTYDFCHVVWDEGTQKYSCNEKEKP